MIDDKFGLRISQLRLAHGLSLSDLSKLIHVSKSEISKYENGYRLPTLDVLCSLISALDTTFEYLVDGKGSKQTIDISDLSAENLATLNAILTLMRNQK